MNIYNIKRPQAMIDNSYTDSGSYADNDSDSYHDSYHDSYADRRSDNVLNINPPLKTPGQLLREKRSQLAIGTQQACDFLKINCRKLEAMEADDYTVFTSLVYARGHLRNYAKLVDISEREIMDCYDAYIGTSPHCLAETTDRADRQTTTQHRLHSMSWWWPYSLVAALILVWVVAYPLISNDPRQQLSTVADSPPAFEGPAVDNVIAQKVDEAVGDVANNGTDHDGINSRKGNEHNPDSHNLIGDHTNSDNASSYDANIDNANSYHADSVITTNTITTNAITTSATASGEISTFASVTEQVDLNIGQPTSASSSTEMVQATTDSAPVLSRSPQQRATVAALPTTLTTTVAAAVDPINTAPIDQLVLSFSDDCWLEVTDAKGKILAAKLHRAGDQLVLQGSAPFNIVLGNATAAEVRLNGKAVAVTPIGSRRTLRFTVGNT